MKTNTKAEAILHFGRLRKLGNKILKRQRCLEGPSETFFEPAVPSKEQEV